MNFDQNFARPMVFEEPLLPSLMRAKSNTLQAAAFLCMYSNVTICLFIVCLYLVYLFVIFTYQILKQFPTSHVLACAPSNSAADLVLQRVMEHTVIPKSQMMRLNAFGRSAFSLPKDIKVCYKRDDWFEPSWINNHMKMVVLAFYLVQIIVAHLSNFLTAGCLLHHIWWGLLYAF